jgi:hypothetical protein
MNFALGGRLCGDLARMVWSGFTIVNNSADSTGVKNVTACFRCVIRGKIKYPAGYRVRR